MFYFFRIFLFDLLGKVFTINKGYIDVRSFG